MRKTHALKKSPVNCHVRVQEMKISSLMKLTNGDISIEEFRAEISNEIEDYKFNILKKGASVPIHVISDTEFEFKNKDLKLLCEHFIENKLSQEELSYIADAIELSSDIYVPDDKIKDIVFEMTDPEVNGLFSKERAKEILRDNAL